MSDQSPQARRDRAESVLPVMGSRANPVPVPEQPEAGPAAANRGVRAPLEFTRRDRRGTPAVPATGAPVNRREQTPQPFHQRVRLEDVERLGVNVDV